MFVGINMFWPDSDFSAQAVRRGLKRISKKGPKHIYAQENTLYYHYYLFGGH